MTWELELQLVVIVLFVIRHILIEHTCILSTWRFMSILSQSTLNNLFLSLSLSLVCMAGISHKRDTCISIFGSLLNSHWIVFVSHPHTPHIIRMEWMGFYFYFCAHSYRSFFSVSFSLSHTRIRTHEWWSVHLSVLYARLCVYVCPFHHKSCPFGKKNHSSIPFWLDFFRSFSFN